MTTGKIAVVATSVAATLLLCNFAYAEVPATKYNRQAAKVERLSGKNLRLHSEPVPNGAYRFRKKQAKRLALRCRDEAVAAHASWYGPGFYGRTTASGTTLTTSTIGVAHKSLPFGTTFHFHYAGRTQRAPVIDRGPYVAGRTWDLTGALATQLGFGGVGTVITTRRPCRGLF